jgi:regulator of sigma E protease
MLDNAVDLLIVVLGFGALIFLHELGHFLAARWAGIRVLTFAVGIGSTIVSYRHGLGWRRGSSEREYLTTIHADPSRTSSISPTEYTLKWIPLGGFVRMLGQEDMHPDRVSDEDDSYQSCPIWKRMIVISAGVIANLITAALAFVAVFLIGLPSTPATVGLVAPNSPAAIATPIDAPADVQPGLRTGDRVQLVDGEAPLEFTDLVTGVAMASPNRPLRFVVERDGYDSPLTFDLEPVKDPGNGLLTVGFSDAPSLTLREDIGERTFEELNAGAAGAQSNDLAPIPGGSTLVAAGTNDAPLTDLPHFGELLDLVRRSDGDPIWLQFTTPNGSTAQRVLEPVLPAQTNDTNAAPDVIEWADHLLGLRGAVTVSGLTDDSGAVGLLEPGDVFARIAGLEFPEAGALMSAIQANANQTIDAVVLREDAQGKWQRVAVSLPVRANGSVGFWLSPFTASVPVIAAPSTDLYDDQNRPFDPGSLGTQVDRVGSRIISINDQPIESFGDVTRILHAQAITWLASSPAETDALTLPVRMELPMRDANGVAPEPVDVTWTLTKADAQILTELNWTLPGGVLAGFATESVVLRADGPIQALGMGLHRTKSSMQRVYLTLMRITQGTVQVRHLNGPIGIAHTGTILADRGVVWLLFFFGLISVNLAVVNFLPIPILDGGQFLFLVYEQFRGKPPPIVVQNVLTLAGLFLIAAMFIVVTYNDVRNLIGI